MKAAQFFGKGNIRVIDTSTPHAKDHEALIAIAWCGICGSDLFEYTHGPMAIPTKERPNSTTGEFLPVIMGHEFCGHIISAPPSSGLTPGQAAIVDPRIYCSKCPQCNTGSGFSETVAVDARLCYPLPDSVDLGLAALIEPLAVAWHAITLCEVTDWANKSVLVFGGGPPIDTRATQNSRIADAVFNPTTGNVGEKCRALTGGAGVDLIFDCAGTQKGIEVGMDALRYKGVYINLALWSSPMIIPFLPFIVKELTVKCSLAYNDRDFKETIDAFVAGRFKDVELMVTNRIHIDDISKDGFDELVLNKDQNIKILVTPDKSNL